MSPAVLTEEQELAVARRGEPLILTAGAGSGKTAVLVERFLRAVREDGLAPGRILAITFTDRAAGELRERVRARFLQAGERAAARDVEGSLIATFHGFCARLLRAHPLMAGLDPDFEILDEGLAARLAERAYVDALRAFLEGERVEAVDLLAAYGVDRVGAMIRAVHAQLRSSGQRFPRLPPARPGDQEDPDELDAGRVCVLLDELLAGFGGAYERLKAKRRAVDFDDLELCAGELLERHEAVRRSWSERFELLMVDEFQDTNPRQLAILDALDRANLFTVGDELQAIYGFRHADVRLFRARRAELSPRGGSLALRSNFRSRPEVLGLVNTLFQDRFEEFAPLIAARADLPSPGEQLQVPGEQLQLRLTAAGPSAGEQEPPVELLLSARNGWDEDAQLASAISRGLPAAPLWRQAEARLLARRVAQLVQEGKARAGEVAILLRALGDLEVYEQALQQEGLGTLAAVGAFWEHPQVGELLAYLRTLANPLDEVALYATLASPLAGVSRDALASLAREASSQRRSVWESANALARGTSPLPERDRAALGSFCTRLREERRQAPRRTLSALIERAIEASAYREHALALERGERRLANIHKLLRLARRFEAREGRDLRGFLEHVARLRIAGDGGESHAPIDGAEPDAVRLMSVHAAKGLEFPVVCVADLGRAPNRRMPELLLDGDRIGLQLVRLDGGKATPALDYEELAAERRREEVEEEDRILYVAVTRARDRLLLSGVVDFERWPDSAASGTAISWIAPALCPEPALLVQAAHDHLPWVDVPLRAHAGGVLRCRLSSPASATRLLALAPGMRPPRDHGTHSPGDPARPGEVAAEQSALEPHAGSGREAGLPRGGQEPLAAGRPLSYTALSELERCGYRFYLERVLGIGEDRRATRSRAEERSSDGRARGTLVHRLLETLDFASAQPISPSQVARVAGELGMHLGAGERNELAELIAAARRSAPAARVARASELRREYPFAFSLASGEPLITGVIDLLAREPGGGLLVLDYKSDRVGPESDLEELVEREYGIQRLLYALAVLRDGAASVEVVHWFLQRPEDALGARFLAADRPALEQRLRERLARARAQGYAVSSRPHRGLCLTCPGRAGLCSWSERETLRETPQQPGGRDGAEDPEGSAGKEPDGQLQPVARTGPAEEPERPSLSNF